MDIFRATKKGLVNECDVKPKSSALRHFKGGLVSKVDATCQSNLDLCEPSFSAVKDSLENLRFGKKCCEFLLRGNIEFIKEF